jgi:hypothetical protein
MNKQQARPTLGIFAPLDVPSMASVIKSGQVQHAADGARDCFKRFADPADIHYRTYNGDADDAMLPIFDFARQQQFEIVVLLTNLVGDNIDALCKAVAQMPRDTFLAIVVVCEGEHDRDLAAKLDTMSPTGSRVAVYGVDDMYGFTTDHTELRAWLALHGLPTPN